MDDLWDLLDDVICRTADKHCPLKEFRECKALTPDQLELLKDRDRLDKLAKKSKEFLAWNSARQARNQCNTAIKNAKNYFVKAQLTVHEKDPRKFWQAINSVWSPQTCEHTIINLKDHTTGNMIDEKLVPEVFNKHLAGVGRKLAERFTNTASFTSTLCDVAFEFVHYNITESEVYKLVYEIQIHKSSAIDCLTLKLLKDALKVLFQQLTYIFNRSLQFGVFPSKWKQANAVLLHKGQDKHDVNNYQPISLLPLPGKLLESIIYSRLYSHLEANHIFSDKQWGFRPD